MTEVPFIIVRNEVAKVMFLHLSVSHSVHRGGLFPGELSGPGGRGCLVRGSVETPSVTATAADGTHPTGVHSCL